MVLADFLTETRRRWLKAFKLFKKSKSRKSARNRVSPSPALMHSPSHTEDTKDVFCPCRAPLPPHHDDSFHSYNSYCSSRVDSLESYTSNRSDSAYNSARSSPSNPRVCYATVTYFNVNDSEDSSSILTEYTLLDENETERESEEDERTQNMINESLELVTTL